MKSNELRIGNYLYNDNVVVKIDGRTIFDIWSCELGFGNLKYSPIEITEEWLLKLGFEKQLNFSETHFIFMKDNFSLFEITDKFIYSFGFNGNHLGYVKNIHELQNLYFALTGWRGINFKGLNP